jgi:hypothetical protein
MSVLMSPTRHPETSPMRAAVTTAKVTTSPHPGKFQTSAERTTSAVASSCSAFQVGSASARGSSSSSSARWYSRGRGHPFAAAVVPGNGRPPAVDAMSGAVRSSPDCEMTRSQSARSECDPASSHLADWGAREVPPAVPVLQGAGPVRHVASNAAVQADRTLRRVPRSVACPGPAPGRPRRRAATPGQPAWDRSPRPSGRCQRRSSE